MNTTQKSMRTILLETLNNDGFIGTYSQIYEYIKNKKNYKSEGLTPEATVNAILGRMVKSEEITRTKENGPYIYSSKDKKAKEEIPADVIEHAYIKYPDLNKEKRDIHINAILEDRKSRV